MDDLRSVSRGGALIGSPPTVVAALECVESDDDEYLLLDDEGGEILHNSGELLQQSTSTITATNQSSVDELPPDDSLCLCDGTCLCGLFGCPPVSLVAASPSPTTIVEIQQENQILPQLSPIQASYNSHHSDEKKDCSTVNEENLISCSAEASDAPCCSSSTSTSSSCDPLSQAIHSGVQCDMCGACPIVGIRYYCVMCRTYDLCSSCELLRCHDSSHPLLKLLTPSSTYGHHATNFKHNNKQQNTLHANLQAAFTYDDELCDPISVDGGSTLTRSLRLTNTGSEPWPIDTRLQFIGGDVHVAGDHINESSSVLVPPTSPGSSVLLTLDVLVPAAHSGVLRAAWRLTANGRKFGPKAFITLNVRKQQTTHQSNTSPESSDTCSSLTPSACDDSSPQSSSAASASTSTSGFVSSDFPYRSQLMQLVRMGFTSNHQFAQLQSLLRAHDGNVEHVVSALVEQV